MLGHESVQRECVTAGITIKSTKINLGILQGLGSRGEGCKTGSIQVISHNGKSKLGTGELRKRQAETGQSRIGTGRHGSRTSDRQVLGRDPSRIEVGVQT